ncbi:MAG: aromatic-L-amino-acid decarboxylase [Algoriphagus sp.]|jgi:aromatic-L-amino-acid decarboxylase
MLAQELSMTLKLLLLFVKHKIYGFIWTGVPAAIIPELKELFRGIKHADSIALDPLKWLYSPLEAGCTLVKNPKHLIATYSSHPEYYNFSLSEEYGLQNSRGSEL